MYVPKNTINHKTQGPINPKPNLTKNDDPDAADHYPDAADHYKRLTTLTDDGDSVVMFGLRLTLV